MRSRVPDESVGPVEAAAHGAGHEVAKLILQLDERADMKTRPLFIELGDGFGPNDASRSPPPTGTTGSRT